jgi:hypothetical protein
MQHTYEYGTIENTMSILHIEKKGSLINTLEHFHIHNLNTMSILHIEKKGSVINTLDHFHIHNLTKENLNMNDICTGTHNPIFDIVRDYYSQK